jgi:DNA polymerase-3 subunit epsilon
MKLSKDAVIILDCQTTAMHPGGGRILEIGWSLISPDSEIATFESSILQGDEVPPRIREITGIDEEHLKDAIESQVVFDSWRKFLQAAPAGTPIVVHYAQFEKAFLQQWYLVHQTEFDLDFICSHRIAKKLFPEIPSQNLRGLAGFFGGQLGELKRTSSHLQATAVVWRSVARRLAEIGIDDLEALREWQKQKTKTARYEYRMSREARLALSTKPGVYRMLAKDGRILYVGKATSLRSRVNSYFRGQKGRDRRKLEMLAQVWDMKVTECETPLEAALLETDEIKKWDPPYNVSLKTGDRRLLFYSHDFTESSETQSAEHPLGPFRPMNVLESLREMQQWRAMGELRLIFYQEIDEEILRKGFDLACASWNLDQEVTKELDLRQWLALGFVNLRSLLREFHGRDPEEVFREQKEQAEENEELTPEDVAEKFKRLVIRSALTIQRAKRLTKLRNADVCIPTKSGPRRLKVRNGHLGGDSPSPNALPWASADIGDYDRMSVLLSEITKHSCTVEPPML